MRCPGGGKGSVADRLAGIVDAAVWLHGRYGYQAPVMLVHAATAPNAVLFALPALPVALWLPSLQAALAASAALTAAYAPTEPQPVPTVRGEIDAGKLMCRVPPS